MNPTAVPAPEGLPAHETAPQRTSLLPLTEEARLVTVARRCTCGMLQSWGLPDVMKDDAELTANAVEHSMTEPTCLVLVVCPAGHLMLLVEDAEAGPIAPVPASSLDEFGRGLALAPPPGNRPVARTRRPPRTGPTRLGRREFKTGTARRLPPETTSPGTGCADLPHTRPRMRVGTA